MNCDPTAAHLMTLLATLSRTAGRVHPDSTWGDRLARVKYCVRGLLTPWRTTVWFSQLRSPALQELVRGHPRIHSKLQRPYLHRRVTLTQRLSVLREHYAFFTNSLDATQRRAVSSPAGLFLAELPASDPTRYSLRLRYDTQFEKEGELTLALQDSVLGEAIFTLSFTVTGWNGKRGTRELFVGGIQGRKGANDRDEIVALTRSLHGLRPKALLVFAVQRLAEVWGIANLRAVGDSEHIYRHFRKRRAIQTSYDSFWEECQGGRDADGNFTLPARPVFRGIDAIPAHKRSLYRKRYALMELLGGQLQQAVTISPAAAVTMPLVLPTMAEPLLPMRVLEQSPA